MFQNGLYCTVRQQSTHSESMHYVRGEAWVVNQANPWLWRGQFSVMDVPSVKMKFARGNASQQWLTGHMSDNWGEDNAHTNTQVAHTSSLILLPPCHFTAHSLYNVPHLSLLFRSHSVLLTQSIRAQLHISLSAVTITLVSPESADGQAQEENRSRSGPTLAATTH